MQWTLDPLTYLETAAQQYGDIFNAPVIGNHSTLIFVSNPQALQQIFSSDTKQFITPSNSLLQPIVGDSSVFVLQGDRHRRERKLLMPPFHGDRMRAYGQVICDLTKQIFDALSPDTPFMARSLMQTVSMEVILKVVFGIYEGERATQLKQRIVQLTDTFKSPWVSGLLFFPSLQRDWGTWSPWGAFRSRQRQVDELLYSEIRHRRTTFDSSHNDILSLLLSARDEAGKGMTDEELRDELLTLLLAGHETTASAIAWALYWIHKLPEVRDKVLQELHGLGPSPDPIRLSQLPYLSAVCSETLRIYPIAVLTVPREVREPVKLAGYALEPGTRLYGCIYLTHHRADLYPDPQQFRPERFLKRQYAFYEFFPFGGGARRCIGEALALFEMKLVLATILLNYDLALASDRVEYPQRRGVTFAPKYGVPLVLQGHR